MKVILDLHGIQQFCRVCLKIKNDLVSSLTQLYIGNYSSTIHEILQLLVDAADVSMF